MTVMELPSLKRMSEEEVERFYAYGFAQYDSGQWNEAADVFRVLCTKRPLEARFWFALGATLQESHSFGDALHAWAMAALLRDEDPYAHFHAAECYFSMDERSEGMKALREAKLRVAEGDPLEGKIALMEERWEMKDGN